MTIFLSYRSDDPAWSILLDRQLSEAFGADHVFRASRDVDIGQIFPDRIRGAVVGAAVVLVIIGPRWLDASRGHRKIDEPDDWVRQEIRLALVSGALVVPVLADGAPPLRPEALPADVRALADRQHIRVGHKDAEGDVRRLTERLEGLVPELRRDRAPRGHDDRRLAAAGLSARALEAALLRISDDGGQVLGLGFLVSADLALTCAHVLPGGRPSGSVPSERAGQAADASGPVGGLRVDLPLAAPPGREEPSSTGAVVERWLPRRPHGGDVALLRLAGSLPGAVPARLIEAVEVWEHPARVFGFPAGRPGGVWHAGVLRARQADGWIQLDLAAAGYRVSKGFSGSPVWDETLGGVVGMVAVAEMGEPPASYSIPTGRILAELPELRDVARPPSPFRGLSAFEEADAAVFHGRRTESDVVASMLGPRRWVTVVGPSGSGKSSLVMAGVVPLMRERGAVPVVVRPGGGNNPLQALAAELVRLLEPDRPEVEQVTKSADVSRVLREDGLANLVPRVLRQSGYSSILIVLDQIEQVLLADPSWTDELAEAVFGDSVPPSVRVLSTLRSDFLDNALAHPVLGPVLASGTYALAPLRGGRLRSVIEAPVDAVPGVEFEAHLVDRILTDAGEAAGALPLLAFTLELLWQRQQDGRLTHQAYGDLGEVRGALAAYAARTWAESVPPGAEPAARRLVTQLLRVSTSSGAATRRIVARDDLDAAAWALAQRLAATRLLVIARSAGGIETVELAHEALITGWPRLAVWAAEDRAFLVWREGLRQDMERWEDENRSPDRLPNTFRLVAAQPWLATRAGDLTAAEREYFARGRARQSTRARRRFALMSVVTAAVVLVLVLGGLFAYQSEQTRRSRLVADSRALAQAAADVATTDTGLSILSALAAYRAAPTQEARNELLRRFVTYREYDRIVSGLGADIVATAVSRDGQVLVTRTSGGKATLVLGAVRGRVRSYPIAESSQVTRVMVSADGTRVAVLVLDGGLEWYDIDPASDQPLGVGQRLPPRAEAGADPTAVMSPDGRVVVLVGDQLLSWDLDAGEVEHVAPMPPQWSGDTPLAGADGRSVLIPTYTLDTGASGLVSVDLSSGSARPLVEDADSVTVSADRSIALSCRDVDTETQLDIVLSRFDVSDGGERGAPRAVRNTRCSDVAVDPTGEFAAVSGQSDDENIAGSRLVELDSGLVTDQVQLSPYRFGLAVLPDLVPTSDGLVLARRDNQLVGFARFVPVDQVVSVGTSTLSDDGASLFTTSRDGSQIAVYDTGRSPVPRASAPRAVPPWPPTDEDDLRLNQGGDLVADREGQALIVIRDTSTLDERARVLPVAPPRDESEEPGSDRGRLFFFFDGDRRLVSVSGTVVQLWDATTGTEVAQFDAAELLPPGSNSSLDDSFLSVNSYPELGHVAIHLENDPVVHVVNLVEGRRVDVLRLGTDVSAVRFSRDGRRLALLRRGGAIELWHRDPLALEREVGGGVDGVDGYFVARFLDDGRYLFAADGIVRVYEAGQRPLDDYIDLRVAPGGSVSTTGAPVQGFTEVSGDGRVFIYADQAGSGYALTLDADLWRERLCEFIGHRELTSQERVDLPAVVDDEPLCTGDPLE